MKSWIILFLGWAYSFSTQAQAFSVIPNPINVEIDLETSPNTSLIIAESEVLNTSSDTLQLKWERILNDKPDCWETSVFSNLIELPPEVSSWEIQVLPNGLEILNICTFLDGLGSSVISSGEAKVVLEITNMNDPLDTLLAEYNFNVSGGNNCVTGIWDIDQESIKLFPNPVSDFFHLTDIKEVQVLEIFNVLGKQVKRSNVNFNQSYDIRDLPSGIYKVNLFDETYRLIKTLNLFKM